MRADELMIGDWIGWLPTWKNEETDEIEFDGDRNHPIIGKVETLIKDCATIDTCDESIEVEDIGLIPIPLTREILERNGWKEAVLRHWNIEDDFAIEKGEDGNIFWFLCGTALVCTLNYVHELQHALRLRGIKKEIVL